MFRGKSWGHGNTQRPVHPSAQTPWIAIPRNSISLASHATMARNNSAIGPSSPSVSQHRAAPLGVGLADLRVSPPHPTKINRKWIAKKKIQERFRSASLFSQPCIQYLVIKKTILAFCCAQLRDFGWLKWKVGRNMSCQFQDSPQTSRSVF